MAVDLGKQYGPLPLGAWVAVVGGGLGIAWYTRQGGSKPATIVEDTSGIPGVGTGSNSMWVQTTPPPTEVAAAFTTNEEWARAAVNYLIAQGYDAALADTAVRKYLESTPLSLSENALIKIALAKYGAPPVLLPEPPPLPVIPPPPVEQPPVTTPPPVNVPTPKPPDTRWIWVTPWPTKHSTLWGIASTAYGSGSKWPTLYNANRTGVRRPDGSMGMIKNPNLIYVGWKIYVP
jgi:LysM domain